MHNLDQINHLEMPLMKNGFEMFGIKGIKYFIFFTKILHKNANKNNIMLKRVSFATKILETFIHITDSIEMSTVKKSL